MFKDLINEKIKEYRPANEIEQELAIMEIMQQFILVSLGRHGFFANAQFHGGTFLKIIHQLNRFSEDLDFLQKSADKNFHWDLILEQLKSDMENEGLYFEISDKSAEGIAVQKAFLKTDSIGKILHIHLPFTRHERRKIKIKLEIDTIPPAGSEFETHYLYFPILMPITTQTLASSFAGKVHALLCRQYVKGRDWYDFLWYCSKNILINSTFLKNALYQQGPWQGQDIILNNDWLTSAFTKKIKSISWAEAVSDVARFLPLKEQEGLQNWSKDLFLYHLPNLHFS
jgi:predicted nucleotidyltransferase component of viral defense system